MKRKTLVSIAALATLIIVDAAVVNVAQAFFGNMMNPGRWFDDDDDYYDRGYHRYGGYGPYGYGGGPYGYGGGPWGYGGGPYGYGGYGGYPGYGGGYPSTIVVNPSGNANRAPAPPPPPRLPE